MEQNYFSVGKCRDEGDFLCLFTEEIERKKVMAER
jgi:hypothetical protein